jgi:hypothetical protein
MGATPGAKESGNKEARQKEGHDPTYERPVIWIAEFFTQ